MVKGLCSVFTWAALLATTFFTTLAGADVPDGAQEITSLVSVRWDKGHNVPEGQTVVSGLRVINRSNRALAGPLGVAVQVLKPAGVGLANATDTTPDGLAVRELIAEGMSLPAGESTLTDTLTFANPGGKPLSFKATPYGIVPGPAAPAEVQDNATGRVRLTVTKPRLDRRSGQFVARLHLQNVSAAPIDAPVSVAISGLTPVDAALVEPPGTVLADGVALNVPLTNDQLAPGKKTPALALRFANPTKAPIAFQADVFGVAPMATGIGELFDAPNAWNRRVDSAALHADSAQMIAALARDGGWGVGHMQIDFSIGVLQAQANTPFRTFTPADGYYTPDCDHTPFPVPAGGVVEGESGYACTQGGDCHLLVEDPLRGKLYEMYIADISHGVFSGMCEVVWSLHRAYPADLRGEQCTSADAAGLPIAPLLFSADEIAAGEIRHAIRFMLPNNRMRKLAYVHPATHAGAPSGASDALPYGSHLRLRADYPLGNLSAGAQVIARAMQRYGMILADGGNIALTARDDRFTQHKWVAVGVDSHSLTSLAVTDFEVVDTGDVIGLTWDCARNGL